MANNPLDELDNPQLRTAETWGQVAFDAYYAILTKGVGKEPFNAQIHSADKRVTALDIIVTPLADMNVTWNVQRSMIAESREYAGIVLPSIKALGVSAKELSGKWVKVTTVETGSTYVDKQGETKSRTTIKFLAIFADENACRADYLATHQPGTTLPADQAPWNGPAQTAAPNQVNPDGTAVNSKERKTAETFLKVYVEKAVKDSKANGIEAVMQSLAGYLASAPIVNKFFTADSFESMAMIAEAMTK